MIDLEDEWGGECIEGLGSVELDWASLMTEQKAILAWLHPEAKLHWKDSALTQAYASLWRRDKQMLV